MADKKLEAALNKAQAKRIDKMLADSSFRRFILTFLEASRIDGLSFQQGAPDATSFMEGRRSLGIEIREMLRLVNPTAPLLLEQERLAWAESVQSITQGDPDEADPYPDFDPEP
jgi:hypothetical protein